MTANIKISPIGEGDYRELACMVGELLAEIMDAIGEKVFNFDKVQTESRARRLVSAGTYWIFIARERRSKTAVGFVSLYESFALYAEGAYGTMPELYVRPEWRSRSIGKLLLETVRNIARKKGWHRIEVTTPPLPEFQRTLKFYETNGFSITGGRKLKTDIGVEP